MIVVLIKSTPAMNHESHAVFDELTLLTTRKVFLMLVAIKTSYFCYIILLNLNCICCFVKLFNKNAVSQCYSRSSRHS
jgi:hypothetical protein